MPVADESAKAADPFVTGHLVIRLERSAEWESQRIGAAYLQSNDEPVRQDQFERPIPVDVARGSLLVMMVSANLVEFQFAPVVNMCVLGGGTMGHLADVD